MQDRERETLRANAKELANLMTENVPFLLRHYMQNGVLTEAEREDIIQEESSDDIKVKLIQILFEKENVSLKSIIEGLNATENQCVSKEIHNLISPEEVVNNGSGDKPEDLSMFATTLVDEVIAKAEKTTGNGVPEGVEEEEEEEEEMHDAVGNQNIISENGGSSRNDVDDTTTSKSDVVESDVEESGNPESVATENEQIAKDKLVEASVEVHTNEEDVVVVANEDKEAVVQEKFTDVADVNGEDEMSHGRKEEEDVPDRSVNFSHTVATVIEDGKHNDVDQEETSSLSITSSPSPTSVSSPGLDAQNGNESESDEIDIEQDFEMPAEAALLTNGKYNSSNDNDEARDNGNKADSETEAVPIEDAELAAILAKKELVRKQVEMFEKKAPAGGGHKVNYVIRTATHDKEPIVAGKQEGDGSNVKNLKNFFQRLSSSDTTSPPPPAPAKSVGKLKVTFPASS